MSENKNNLNDENNYFQNCNYKSNYIIKQLNVTYIEYINYFINNILQNDNNYNKTLFLKGFNTINHVFRNIFIYTNNLELSIFYAQKAFYYYTEFLSQIDSTNHDFLQLNSNDAILFVYKKTIYLINKKFSENNCYDNNILNIITIYNKIIFNLFEYFTFNFNNICKNKFLFVYKLQELITILDKKSILNNILLLNNIDIFIFNILSCNFDNNKIVNLLEILIKKLSSKKNINNDISINFNIKNILTNNLNNNKIIKLIIN